MDMVVNWGEAGIKLKLKSEKGITLIELLVVMVLIGLTTALVLPRGLNRSATKAALDTEAQKLAGVIRLARQKSMADKASYQVVLNGTNYSLKVGGSVVKTESLDSHVQISSPASGTSMVFTQEGMLNPPSTLKIEINETDDSSNKRTLTVNKLGTVDIE